jgi:hypothetical protein
MTLALQMFLILIALWSAHVAGSMYTLARDDPKLRLGATLRTAFSIMAAVLIFIV